MDNNINDIIRLYVRHEATAEQCQQVKEFVLDNVDNFNVVLKIIREEAMKEMGLDPEKDFLPGLLKERSPREFANSRLFAMNPGIISADFAYGQSDNDDDIFGMLCRELLGQEAAWY